MKVLLTCDSLGGVWTYALELAHGLGARGVEVSVAVLGRAPTAAEQAELNAAPISSWFARETKLEWMPDPGDEVEASGVWLQSVAEQLDPDVVHLNGYVHAALPWRPPVVVTGHSCVLSWWRAVQGVPAPEEEWRRYAAAVRAGLDAADVVVAPTAAMLRALEREYSFRGARLVIPNGRRDIAATPRPKDDVIVGVGRVWDEAKNLAALQRVAPRLRWPLLLAGEVRPPRREAADTSTGRLSSDETIALLRRAAVFAEPALYEPFGLAALEAGLARCALVLGDIPSLREVWQDAVLFVDPTDDDALCDVLQALTRDPALVQEWGSKARRRALSFTTARMATAYEEVYRSVVTARPRPAAEAAS